MSTQDKDKQIAKIWKDWTREDWDNAIFCDTCGLPLLQLEPEEGKEFGEYLCVACEWEADLHVLQNELKIKLVEVEDKRQQVEVLMEKASSLLRYLQIAHRDTIDTRVQLQEIAKELSNAARKI